MGIDEIFGNLYTCFGLDDNITQMIPPVALK